MRIGVMTLCFMICFFIPNFINFLSFVGSFLFPILGIYIPVLLNYSYFKRKGALTLRKKIVLLSVMIVCAVLFTCSTIQSLVTNHSE